MTPAQIVKDFLENGKRLETYKCETNKPVHKIRHALDRLGYFADSVRVASVPGTNEVVLKAVNL